MVGRGGGGREGISLKGGKEEAPRHATVTLISDPKTDPIIIISTSRELTHLFLGGGLLLSLGLGALLALATVTGLGASLTQATVGSLLTGGHRVTLDLGDGLGESGVVDGEGSADAGGDALTLAVSESGLDGLDVLSGGVELLELTTLAGEEDQAGLVVLETGDVLDQGLLGVVGAAVVDRDTDGAGELLGDASLL